MTYGEIRDMIYNSNATADEKVTMHEMLDSIMDIDAKMNYISGMIENVENQNRECNGLRREYKDYEYKINILNNNLNLALSKYN